MEPVIRLSVSVDSFTYSDGTRAMSDIGLTVHNGEFVGILGSNGSGKTTLLNVITGELRPRSGNIVFNGHAMDGLPPYAFASAGIARVFQSVQIFPRLTVRENVEVAQIAAGGPDISAKLPAREALDRVRLQEFENELARDISYGHQRLLEIAMAVAAGAQLILLDEPTAGLSPALVETVIDCLRELNAAGTSLVLIEHETEVVFRVCETVWVLNEGRVIARGTPAEIRQDRQVLDLYLGASQAC